MATSANRITGLATGLDIDSIVKSSMQAYQNKIDKVYKQKSLAEIKQQLYRDVINDGQDFYNKYFDITKSGNLVSSSSFSSTSFISSNEAVATAVGSSTALKSNYTISVSKMAKSAKAQLSSSELGFAKDSDGKFSLASDLQISLGSNPTEATTVLIRKEDILSANITSEKELAKFINDKASSIGMKAYVSDFSSGKITIETKNTGSNQQFKITSGSITEEYVNGSESTLTIGQLLLKNADGKYDSNQDIEIKANDSNGTEQKLIITADTLRNAVSNYTSNKENVNALKEKLSSSTFDGKLTKDDLDGLKATRAYVNSKIEELSSKDSDTSEYENKLTRLNNIISGFDSADVVTISKTGSDNDVALLSNLTTEAINYDNEKINSTMEDTLNSILKDKFGTTDTEGKTNKISAKIDGDSIKFNDGNNINYVVGNRVYAQIDKGTAIGADTYVGNGLEATITNMSTGESIKYTDKANSSNANEKVGNSNTIVVDGASITINSEGTEVKSGDKTEIKPAITNLTAKTDVTSMKDNIVKFVNDYNEYVTKLNTLLTEKKYRDYEPLTEDQKKEMKDTEITAWEKKVKSGQLRGDSDLRRIRDNLVNSMTSAVSGAGITLKDMGISLVESYGTTKDGTFTIDESKLTSALENNTEEVAKLFTSKGDTDSTTGIGNRMKTILNNEVVSTTKSAIIAKAGMEGTTSATTSTLAKQIAEYEKKLEELQDWFDDKEQALYSKWANIETIMNNYNSQASYLTSMFSSGS